MAIDGGQIFSGFQMAMTVLGAVLMAGAVLFLMWLFYRQMQYKIPVTVHKVLDNNNVVEYYDKARKVSKDDRNELHLKKLKTWIPNPPSAFYTKTARGERLYMRWDGGKVFSPQKVTYNSPLVFEPATYNILSQMAWRIKTRAERHRTKSFWDLYGTVIMWTGFIVITAITMWIMFTKLELVAGSINALANAVSNIQPTQVIN